MDKESKDVELDKLLEEEMIREAELIEKSLLGDQTEDTPISEEEIDKSYERFLKRLKAEGLYQEDAQENSFRKEQETISEPQSAEIVQFPGKRGKFMQDGGTGSNAEKSGDEISVVSFVQKNIQEEYLKNAQKAKEEEEKITIAELQQMFDASFAGVIKPKRNLGKAAGFAVLLALGILAGSMASQADKANFVSTIEYIIK